MRKILVKHTHIEISPYEKGECEQLELSLSIRDDINYKYIPIGFLIHNETLYLPRGINLDYLQRKLGGNIEVSRDADSYKLMKTYYMTASPRDEIQEMAEKFIMNLFENKDALKYSQIGINLETGDGKTFSMVNAIIKSRYKSIIITHSNKIKSQWINEFSTMSNIPRENLIDISGSNIMSEILVGNISGDVYFINHQTIQSFIRSKGYDMLQRFFSILNIGIKVYDEAHLQIKNTFITDMFSNTMRTFYVTATFERSSKAEQRIFDKAYGEMYRFGKQLQHHESKRRHMIYIPTYFSSSMSSVEAPMLNTPKGLSAYKYIDYQLNEDPKKVLINKLKEVLLRVSKMDGFRILICIPKIDAIDRIYTILEDMDLDKSIGKIYSKNKVEQNEENCKCDIILCTFKSIGTGANIKNLRVIINLDPFSSTVTMHQLSGRLRELNDKDDTFFIDFVDMSTPQAVNSYNSRKKYMKTKAKKILIDK